MQTSVIRYRVADFLRQYQPFASISLEDLLAFSGTGRVIFHEDEIYIFRQGEARAPVLWVIQQGSVEIIDETAAGGRLCDVLGPGDILGLGRAQDAETHPFTARTVTEVILYSFAADAFTALAQNYPEALRYLTAHLSATTRHTRALQAPANRERLQTEREKTSWLRAAPVPAALLRRRMAACEAGRPIREVVGMMSQARAEIVVVVSASGNPEGLISGRDLRELVPAGPVQADAPAELVINRSFRTVPPGLQSSDYLLEILRGRCQPLLVTADGTAETPLEGIVTDADLAIHCGRNPVPLMREMLAAQTVEDLNYLRERAGAFLAEELAGPGVVEWFWHMQSELHAVLMERIVAIATAEMARAGRTAPALRVAWLCFGGAGRRDVLAHEQRRPGLVYEDPPPEIAAEVAAYFSTLSQKVGAKLKTCGFRPRQAQHEERQDAICLPLSAWQKFYADLIRDPIGNAIYTARELFDFQAIHGDQTLVPELQACIGEQLREHEGFISVLANDTLANLPPLTFFQGSVIEPDGTRKQLLDLERTALTPIVDAARVLALANQDVAVTNTLRRLESAAGARPQHAPVFNDAADGLRIASYQHAVAYDARGGGAPINPASLSRFDQRLLKSAFDSIRRLLELTDSIHC